MCDKAKVELKLGDTVSRGTLSLFQHGKVVAIMSDRDSNGDEVVINSGGIVYLCMKDGYSTYGMNWTKVKRKVKGTVYLNIYKDGRCFAYKDEEHAKDNASLTAVIIAKPVDYEYEDED